MRPFLLFARRSVLRPASVLLLSGLVLLAGCDKDEDVLPDPTPDPHANTVVALQVKFMLNGSLFDPATMDFTDSLGVKVNIDRLRFFISQPYFLDDNGDTVATFPDRYILADMASNGQVRNIGEVDGHLHTLHFGLGLDSAANHADPLLYTEPPLNDATMSWGWNPAVGYQFLQLEGAYDLNGDGVLNASDPGYLYHCGSDALLTPKELEVHVDATTGGNLILVVECEVDELLKGVDVMAGPVGEMPNALTRRVMSNLATSLTHP